MEGYCRGCLSKYDPNELIQYNEKNRRLFVYSTGLQVKRNDNFIFQLCKECYNNMKVACNFKKYCRNSDKKLKSYLNLKESEDNVELVSFLHNTDDCLKLRLPINVGNSTPINNKTRDDDNESTCTSIQNFMTDILQAEEIPDSEARIIREVIEEEADILEDSLDSHWLQDEVSVDSDFRLDFSFSPFSTPRSLNNTNEFTPKKITNQLQFKQPCKESQKSIIEELVEKKVNHNLTSKPVFNLDESQIKNEFHFNIQEDNKCIIDVNLENALKNDTAQEVLLDEILTTPPMIPNISEPPTPMITNILFGENIDPDIDTTHKEVIDEPKTKENDIQEDIDIIDEFLKVDGIKADEFDNSLMDIEEVENIDKYFNKPVKEDSKSIKRPTSPIEDKFCITNFYCKMCKRQFKNLVALKVHCTKYHNYKIEKPKTKRIRKPYICHYCGKVFTSSRCIVKHLENHESPKTYECKKCTMIFTTESRLKFHEVTHTGIKVKSKNCGKKYICSICGAECSSSSNYNIHKRRHLKKFIVSCEECGKGFHRNSDLTIHMRRHTGERPYDCRYCPRSFSRQDTLTKHMKHHTGEKPFACQFCDKKFSKAYDLKFHQNNSKSCVQQQMEIVNKEKNNILKDILVTNAFVF